MPGTPPGCRLMAGRDKRSSMETGKCCCCFIPGFFFFFKSLSDKIFIFFFFFSTASRSLRRVTRCPPSAATTWCTTGSRAWPSACTGTCGRGRRGWRTPPTRRTRRPEAALARPTGPTPGVRSSQPTNARAASRYLASSARPAPPSGEVTQAVVHIPAPTQFITI